VCVCIQGTLQCSSDIIIIVVVFKTGKDTYTSGKNIGGRTFVVSVYARNILNCDENIFKH